MINLLKKNHGRIKQIGLLMCVLFLTSCVIERQSSITTAIKAKASVKEMYAAEAAGIDVTPLKKFFEAYDRGEAPELAGDLTDLFMEAEEMNVDMTDLELLVSFIAEEE